MGSMERIMPGASTVSTSSRSSRPGSLPVINKPGHSAEPIPVSNTLPSST